jgi:hypothetical protein
MIVVFPLASAFAQLVTSLRVMAFDVRHHAFAWVWRTEASEQILASVTARAGNSADFCKSVSFARHTLFSGRSK